MKSQPQAAKKPQDGIQRQPPNQPERKWPLKSGMKPKKQPPVGIQKQPLNAESQAQSLSQPPVAKSGHQPVPSLQPDPDPETEKQQLLVNISCPQRGKVTPNLSVLQSRPQNHSMNSNCQKLRVTRPTPNGARLPLIPTNSTFLK